MKKSNNIKFIYILFYILICLIKQISLASVTSSIRCLQVNQFNNLTYGKKTIGNKKKCFDVSNNCCFINLTYYYGGYPLIHEYCQHLDVKIDEFKQFLYNLYNDDEMFYANFTAHNYNTYRTIGRNLETNLTDKLTCYIGPKNYEEYSTYVVNNCKEFVDDVCMGQKNNTQFNEFMSGFHKNYSNAYCNKKEEGKKCIKYNGTRANDKMVKPLLDELINYLQADNENETYTINYNNSNVDIILEEDDDDGSNTFLDAWLDDDEKTIIKNCSARPEVVVNIECPPGYVFQEFLIYNKILLFILMLILF